MQQNQTPKPNSLWLDAPTHAVIVSGHHWQTLYVNGTKTASGHRLTQEELKAAGDCPLEQCEQSCKHVSHFFSLPSTFAEYEQEEKDAQEMEDNPNAVFVDGKLAGFGHIVEYALDRIKVE